MLRPWGSVGGYLLNICWCVLQRTVGIARIPGTTGLSPKYMFSGYFLLGMCQDHSLWITSSRAASPCAPGAFGGYSAPAPLLGDGFAAVDLLGLGFPTWAHISDLFWKEGRGESVSLPQGEEIINNSGVRTFLRPIPQYISNNSSPPRRTQSFPSVFSLAFLCTREFGMPWMRGWDVLLVPSPNLRCVC